MEKTLIKFIISKKFLYREYVLKEKSLEDISKQIGCSKETIRKRLINFFINRRPSYPFTLLAKQKCKIARKKQEGKNHPRYGKTNSKEMREKISRNHKDISGKKNPMYGRHHSNETKNKMGFKRLGKYKGDKNPNWRGGIMFEPYDKNFNNKFKRAIRKRDNYICLKCNKHQEKLKRTLTVHHIDYNKKLSIPQNCCALCNRCNVEANFNRKHWTKFFQSMLTERYEYNYSKIGDVIIGIKNEI